MKKFLIYSLLLFLVTGNRCKRKEYPKGIDPNDSVFYSKLLINGLPLEITTGENGYYMFSSFKLDSSDIYNLIGEFKQAGCSNCTNSLRIQINDSKFSLPSNLINIDSALQVKTYSFLSGLNDLGYSVDFNASFNKTSSSVLWDFGDGGTSSLPKPNHIFKPGVYKVSVTITGADQCQSILSNTLSLYTANDLNTFISASASANSFSLAANPIGGTAPYAYLWTLGDGTTAVTQSVNHTYNADGSYNISLQVTDANGKISTCLYNAVAGANPSGCAANYTFSNISAFHGRVGLSKVSIQFTDGLGNIYTTDNDNQPSGSSLEIVSVQDFVKNENNQLVKKLSLKFNCTLYNGTQSVSLQGTDVHVGLAYK